MGDGHQLCLVFDPSSRGGCGLVSLHTCIRQHDSLTICDGLERRTQPKKPSPFPTARGSPLRPSLLGDITWGDIPWGRVISLGDLGCGIIESTPIDEVKALCLSTPGSATRLTGGMVSSDGHNNKTKSLHPPRWPMRESDAFPPSRRAGDITLGQGDIARAGNVTQGHDASRRRRQAPASARPSCRAWPS